MPSQLQLSQSLKKSCERWCAGLERKPTMGKRHQDVHRVFQTWLELSEDEEILTLKELAVAELKRRGYTVSQEVRPPERKKE